MGKFAGFYALGSTAVITEHTVNTAGTPTAPASAPTYAVYDTDAATAMDNSSGSMTSTTTGWYRCSVNCTAANGYAAGSIYTAKIDYTIGSTSYATDQKFQVT